jgi:hypothetical protein
MMSKKLLAGGVATMLALTPTVASAAGPARAPTADIGGKQPPAPQCIGLIGQCQGYRYMCETASYPRQLAYFTNSDATEDWYEAEAGHPWHCSGD